MSHAWIWQPCSSTSMCVSVMSVACVRVLTLSSVHAESWHSCFTVTTLFLHTIYSFTSWLSSNQLLPLPSITVFLTFLIFSLFLIPLCCTDPTRECVQRVLVCLHMAIAVLFVSLCCLPACDLFTVLSFASTRLLNTALLVLFLHESSWM